MKEIDFSQFGDRWFDAVQRREYPGAHARAAGRVARHKIFRALGYVKHDRTALEHVDAAFVENRHLPERLFTEIVLRLFLRRVEQPLAIGKTSLLERPADA